MRVLVTGSRSWQDQEAVWSALDALACRGEPVTVVHGDCPQGADALASAWVTARRGEGWPVHEEPHPADWNRGRSAGFRRNAEMVALGADLMVTFIDRCQNPRCPTPGVHGSHGAVHCATAAAQAGIPVHHIRPSVSQRP
jgi:hypothetical protein